MRNHHAAGLLLAAGLVLAGCSGGSGGDAKPTAATSAQSAAPSAAAATTSAPAGPAVKLSATWVPKLNALSDGPGLSDCAADSGSSGCSDGIGSSVVVFGQIAHAIDAANAKDEYPKTIVELGKLLDAASAYTDDECPGDENADIDGSPCPKNAIAVSIGVTTLEFIMQTDEANAGVA